MWFWIFTHTKLKHKSRIKIETMHIKNKNSTIGTLPHPNGTIVWNECLMKSETRVGRIRTRDAYRKGVKSIKHFL